jgi:hypothetical protein
VNFICFSCDEQCLVSELLALVPDRRGCHLVYSGRFADYTIPAIAVEAHLVNFILIFLIFWYFLLSLDGCVLGYGVPLGNRLKLVPKRMKLAP